MPERTESPQAAGLGVQYLSVVGLVVFVLNMTSGLIGCRLWTDIIIKKEKKEKCSDTERGIWSIIYHTIAL